ncbi:hypothetical protein BHU72_12190 [Desulfuribacillus stibiiarsenatis]|uniref:Glycosyltransferase n=1 Tax=Desulfuribacillus stibiiarsenatis TaxID=1390249 RepID=A0A1E5L212_9FIRM|nr:TIGR04282 family arsenosugar biosynthesis glycosyltransferase [Desulfuribacillus stibiiarsenatis]OEH84160.1 hypothetical protein BHU72_12190 [Desulfuribacillus stibiiarsenatis]
MHKSPLNSIVIMSRAPKPGATKTRLTPPLTPEQACQVHEFILKHISDHVAEFPGHHYLFYTGGQVTDFNERVNSSAFTFQQQLGDTLGERMSFAFQHILQSSNQAKKVLMIGSDIPLLTHDHFQEAFAALDSHDVVLGPNDDGGYYLIGLKALHPELFIKHQWGTQSVLQTTLDVIRQKGLNVHLLAEEIDIDTVEDIDKLLTSKFLNNMASSDPKYKRMLDFFEPLSII